MSIRDVTKKGRGRPATGKGLPVTVRIQAEQLAALDAWIATLNEPPTRPAAVRMLLDQALKTAISMENRDGG